MKRLVLLLTLFLIWPLTVCAQMVSPGGGTNIFGNVAIVGGTCQSPMSMNGIDSVGNISCQAPQVSTGATAPTNPVNGQQWFDTTNNTLNIWNGTAWVPVSGTGGAFTPPDGSTWTAAGLTGLASLGVNGNTTLGGNLIVSGSTNLVGPLTFNGVPMGGTCAYGEFVSALSATGIPTCSPWVGGGPAIGPTPPPNPNAGDLWVNTADPVPTLEIWDGVAWIVVSNPSAANTSPTPPVNPIVGQIWYDSTTTPPIMKIWDGTAWVVAGGEWAPLTNPAGGVNNYAAINITSPTAPTSPATGQLWFNTTDLQTYIYYNDGTSSQWVPIVNLGGSGGGGGVPPSGSTIDSPTFTGTVTMPPASILNVAGTANFSDTVNFTGTLNFPDGSYYDTNGHEVMKNLGVGIVANTAGVGGVTGNSIAVGGCGWGSTTDVNCYWDHYGIEQMNMAFSSDFYAPVASTSDPDGPNFTGMSVESDPANDALQNPWGEYFFQNKSNPRPSVGEDQTWQVEGIEAINGLGIHDNNWDTQYGCTNGVVEWLNSCAIMALTDTNYNNILWKSEIANQSSGNAAMSGYELTNNGLYTGGIYLTGSGYTANTNFQPNQMVITTSAPNGIVQALPTTFFTITNGDATLSILNKDTGGTSVRSGLYINAGDTGRNLFVLQNGSGNTGSLPTNGGLIYEDGSLTFSLGFFAGDQFQWSIAGNPVANMNSTGLNVVGNGTVGAIAVNGNPIITNEVAFSAAVQGQCGGVCTPSTNAGYASRVGNHVTVQLQYVATCPSMCGWLQISGFPWRNTNNTGGQAECALEVGGMPFDTNYWMATCRMLQNWDGCLPVEIGSNVPAAYYSSTLVPPGQQMSIGMSCSYLTDSMSP